MLQYIELLNIRLTKTTGCPMPSRKYIPANLVIWIGEAAKQFHLFINPDHVGGRPKKKKTKKITNLDLWNRIRKNLI
jgi:hypothetical protein